MAYQHQGAICIPNGNSSVGSNLHKETREVGVPVDCQVRQYIGSILDQQRDLQIQSRNDYTQRTVLEISDPKLQGFMFSHSGRQESHSRCSFQAAVPPHPTPVSHQGSSTTVNTRKALDHEAQFFLSSSMADSSRPTKISQMRSYLRFAVVMDTQPMCPSELFLIQYSCFLARSLPLPSIQGYLDAVRILHNWLGYSYDASDLSCPRLHMILAGIKNKGIPTKGQRKAAFGAEQLLSFKAYCYQFSKRSVQRAAWAAIIVCFWGCIRSDNVAPKSAKLFDSKRQICATNLQRILEGFLAILDRSKTSSSLGKALRVLLPQLDNLIDLCPVRAIDMLLLNFAGSNLGPLFQYSKDGSVFPLLYKDIRGVIRDWAQKMGIKLSMYGTHSARSGGATTAYKSGVDEIGIMKLGSWLSNTFLSYVKQDVIDMMQIHMKMAKHMKKQTVL